MIIYLLWLFIKMNIECSIFKDNILNDYELLKIKNNIYNKDKKVNIIIIDDFFGGYKFLYDIYSYLELYFYDYIINNNSDYFILNKTTCANYEFKKVNINDSFYLDKNKKNNNVNYCKLFTNLIKCINKLKNENDDLKIEVFFFLYRSLEKNEDLLEKIKELKYIHDISINGITMINSVKNNDLINLDTLLNTNVWINLLYDNYNNINNIFKQNVFLSVYQNRDLKLILNDLYFDEVPFSKYILVKKNFNNKVNIKDTKQNKYDFNFVKNKNKIKISFFIFTINNLIDNVDSNLVKVNIEYFKILKNIISKYSFYLNSKNKLKNYNKYIINILNFKLIEFGNLIINSVCKKKLDDKIISENLYKLTIKSNSYLFNKAANIIDRILNNLINYKIIDKISSFKIDLENKKLEKSLDFITSFISLTTWGEEINSNSSMGLVLKIHSTNFCKLGVGSNLIVNNFTTSFFPYNDYLLTLNNYLEKNYIPGNINGENIIFGNAIGDGNCILPIYICKSHWKKARVDLNNMIGIISAHNPFGYNKNKIKSIFKILVDMSTHLFFSGEKTTSKLINCYFLFFRTCSELCFEFKYNRGIKTVINSFIKNPKKKIMYDQFYYTILLGQILSTGFIMDNSDVNIFIDIIIEELIRINIKDLVFPNLKPFHDNDYEKNIQSKKNSINYHFKVLLGFLKMYDIIKKIINKLGSFNKLIKMLDSNYGLLDEELLDFIKKNIKNNQYENNFNNLFKDLYNERGMKYSRNILIKYIEYGFKYKKSRNIISLINNSIK
jgi:hypothetical protein